jgi:hypothetical protein
VLKAACQSLESDIKPPVSQGLGPAVGKTVGLTAAEGGPAVGKTDGLTAAEGGGSRDFVAIPISVQGPNVYRSRAMLVFCGGYGTKCKERGFPLTTNNSGERVPFNSIILSEYCNWRLSMLNDNSPSSELSEAINPGEFRNLENVKKIHVCAQADRPLNYILSPFRCWSSSLCRTDEEWLSWVLPFFDGNFQSCVSDNSDTHKPIKFELSRTPPNNSGSWWRNLFGRIPLKLPDCDVYICAINFNCRGIFNYGNEGDLCQLRAVRLEKPNCRCAVIWCGSQILNTEVMRKSSVKIVLEAWPDLKDVLLIENNRELNDNQKKALNTLVSGTDQEYKELLRLQNA